MSIIKMICENNIMKIGSEILALFLFIALTLVAYISIDFAVYWVGLGEMMTTKQIIFHHMKMIPIYFVANILLSYGFLSGNNSMNTLLVFSISIAIWIISLLVVSMVLYKTYPSPVTLLGFAIIGVGIVVVNKGVGAI